jgi:hypothetical protein
MMSGIFIYIKVIKLPINIPTLSARISYQSALVFLIHKSTMYSLPTPITNVISMAAHKGKNIQKTITNTADTIQCKYLSVIYLTK